MGRKSYFTDAQWDWIAQKKRAGYHYSDLSDFLGVPENTISSTLTRRKLIPIHDDLPPLRDCRLEFLRLGEPYDSRLR